MIVHRQSDPTRTLVLRRRYARAMRRRWGMVRKTLRQAILTNDVFLLQPTPRLFVAPARGRFGFGTIAQRVNQFMDWLHTELETQVIDRAARWQREYIQPAYERATDLAEQLLVSAFEDLEDPGRVLRRFPGRHPKIDELTERQEQRLQTIIATTEQAIRESTRLALEQEKPPKDLLQEVTTTLARAGTVKAEELTGTGVIETANEALLDVFERSGVQEVIAEPEFLFTTAGDARVCQRCTALEDRVYTIRQARGVIPVHPRCRCRWTPKPRRLREAA